MRMTLDETWKQCLSMWRWIAKEVRNGNKTDVDELKGQWRKDQGLIVYRLNSENCFFCQYSSTGITYNCNDCPARQVDRGFHCMETNYDHQEFPIKFYNKLMQLNRERLKAKN